MIKSFRHKGLAPFYASGSKAGIRPDHAAKLQRQLDGHYAIWVSGNWRLTFAFEGTDVVLLDYMDYH